MAVVKSLKWFCVVALVFVCAQLRAEAFDDEFDEKPWVEIEVSLPPFPETDNLIAFTVGAVEDTKYLIDGNSLSVGSDGVVRYSLVVVSSTGAKTISYEGMRCNTSERRLYAFGRADRTWSKARVNQWVRIRGGSNNHHVELYTNYFCAIGAATVLNADDARRVLRNGG